MMWREGQRDEHGTQDVVMVANQLAEVTDVQIDHEVAVLRVNEGWKKYATVAVPDGCV